VVKKDKHKGTHVTIDTKNYGI